MLVDSCGQKLASALDDLPLLLSSLGCRKVLLVLDRGAARASGNEARLMNLLDPTLVAVFEDFTPNPRSEQALAAGRLASRHGASAIVGFGGGSCMDVAKVGGLAAGSADRAEQLVRGEPGQDVMPLPIIAIPTTSGTGSDATHFAAIYHQGHKISVAHTGMRPRGVVLDASLHAAMPPFIAATTGLDALCQATESMWAVAATEESITHATEAQGMIIRHLAASVVRKEIADREAMMHGAHRAGHAINISKTTASHALSYELTTRFGIAHGLAVALTLGHVAAFNAGTTDTDCAHPGGATMARTRVAAACAGFGVAAAELPLRMKNLLSELSLPCTLAQAGVPRDALAPMADAADVVRLSNNPRRMSRNDALSILEQAF